MPVMEGKSVLFKLYGGTDIIPICIEEKDSEKMITLIKRILPGLSIINLEDIKAPNCFTIENELNNFTQEYQKQIDDYFISKSDDKMDGAIKCDIIQIKFDKVTKRVE